MMAFVLRPRAMISRNRGLNLTQSVVVVHVIFRHFPENDRLETILQRGEAIRQFDNPHPATRCRKRRDGR
jgi:hypothetical protein